MNNIISKVMKRIMFILLVTLVAHSPVFSQEKAEFTRFDFSGYKVCIIPSDEFSISFEKNVKASKRISDDNTLTYIIEDQRGRVPKDTVYIYTDNIGYLSVHNGVLEILKPLKADSLTLSVAVSSGIANLDVRHLDINVSGGGSLKLEGKAESAVFEVGASSHLDAKKFNVDKAKVDVRGYSSLKVSAKKNRKYKSTK